MPNMLNEQDMAKLGEILEQDAANPAPEEEQPEMEEAEISPDEAEEANENTEALGEGDGEATDEEALPDPTADAETQAPADYALPEGIGSVEQLIGAYEALREQERTRGDEMRAYREMNEQLVAIAEALGYGKDIESVDLNVDERLRESDPEAYAQGQMRREIANQLKPMLDQQQKHLKVRLIDQAWKSFASEHADVNELMDDIRAEIAASPMLADSENGLEAAYHMVRSKRYTPEKAMMEDDAFVARAAENPKIRERVIEEYLKSVSRGDEAPASVGSGGSAVPAGRKPINTLEEANKAFRKMLRMN